MAGLVALTWIDHVVRPTGGHHELAKVDDLGWTIDVLNVKPHRPSRRRRRHCSGFRRKLPSSIMAVGLLRRLESLTLRVAATRLYSSDATDLRERRNRTT